MLIGHYAPAFALSRVRPSLRLWQLFLATQAVDILWSVLVLVGVEHARIVPGFTASNDLDLWDMPYSHGLVATGVWTVLAFAIWRTTHTGASRTGDAVVIAVAVASHFIADLVVHVHDLPVVGTDGTKLGFGLWRDRGLALVVETGLFAVAAAWWWWPRPSLRTAIWLVTMTTVAAASFFIPAPPDPRVLAATGLSLHLACAALAAWAERTRTTSACRGSRSRR